MKKRESEPYSLGKAGGKARNPDKKGEVGDKKQGKGKAHEIVQYVLILGADYALNSA